MSESKDTLNTQLSITADNVAYARYLIHITGIRSGEDARDSCCQMSVLKFWENGQHSYLRVHPIAVQNPGGDAHVSESAMNLLDQSTHNKWCDFAFNHANCSNLTVTFENPVCLSAYSFTTANDAPWRDPVAWSIYGTDDLSLSPANLEQGWTLLDTRARMYSLVPLQRQISMPSQELEAKVAQASDSVISTGALATLRKESLATPSDTAQSIACSLEKLSLSS